MLYSMQFVGLQYVYVIIVSYVASIRNDKDIFYYYYFISTLKMVFDNKIKQHMYYIIKSSLLFY